MFISVFVFRLKETELSRDRRFFCCVGGVCVSAADKMTVATKTKTYKLVVHKKGFGGSGESLPCTLSNTMAVVLEGGVHVGFPT